MGIDVLFPFLHDCTSSMCCTSFFKS